jgi:outer membrane receptor protein involved in Fe transport
MRAGQGRRSTAAKSGRRLHANLLYAAAALSSSALLLTSEGHAQEPADQGSQQGQVEEVLVTGSRIMRSGMQTPTPVTTISSDQMSQLDPGNMVDALSELPQFLNNTDAVNRSNFLTAAGGAFLNVRGLGTNRTLTLLDGHRVPPSDRSSSVDTNLFPEALVQRVDVVTGGASAAYGADALSGVVNFILNTNYEGFDAKVQGGQTRYGDGDNWKASFTGGVPVGDKVHVTFSAQEFHQDEVRGHVAGLDDRDWFGRWGYVTNPAFRASDPPGTNPERLVLPNVHSTQFTPGGKINQPDFSYDQYVFIDDGTQLKPFEPGPIAAFGGTLSTSGGPDFEVANLAERTILTAEVNQVNLFANVNYDIDDRTSMFFRAMSGENYAYQHKVNGGLGPSMMGIWHATIFEDNAFLPEAVREAMAVEGVPSFRMDKNGAIEGRNNYADDYTDGTEIIQRIYSFGLDRQLANDWTLSAFLQYGKSDKENMLDNLLRVDREFLAMDAVEVYGDRRDSDGDGIIDEVAPGDRGTGDIICNVQRYNPTLEQLADSVKDVLVPSPTGPRTIASPVGLDNTIEGCVPLDIFGYGNVSPEAAAYVVSDKWAKSQISQKFAEVVLTGNVFEGWRSGGLSFSVGGNFRKEDMDQVGYPLEITSLGPPKNAENLGIRGIPGGFTGGSPNLHQFSVLSTFAGGFDVWEVFGETFIPLAKRLNLSLAGRYSDYSLTGPLVTWKVGFDSQLTSAFRFRATLSKDAREPSFQEQFDFNGGGGSVDDPLNGNQTFSITVNSGGNPNLEAEEADTYTFGFVYQPQRLPGLAFSADYYNIDLSETIGSLGTQRIVDDCYTRNIQEECPLIERTGGIITRVSNVLVNIDNAKVSGTDLELTYQTEPDWFGSQSESLSLRFLAGYLGENSTTPLGGVKLDRAGATTLPEWTTTATLNYRVGPWGFNLQNRWIDSTLLDAEWVEGVDIDDNTIDSVDYTNLGVRYSKDAAGGNSWDAFLNVTNLFDENPPIIPTGVGRSIPSSTGLTQHNAIHLGRRYVIGAEFRF